MVEGGSLGNVRYLGYLQRAELDALMELTDVCINLRYPSNGEMSSALIDMLGRGKAVAVSNYAQFTEFPDGTCVKIDLGPNESDALADELLRLATDEGRRRSLGEAARNYITQNHSPDAAAGAILKFIEDHSTAEPLLSRDDRDGLLFPDGILRRYTQMLSYNTRRLLSYLGEQGIAQAVRQALRRASVKTM
jgi:hypothetical protein